MERALDRAPSPRRVRHRDRVVAAFSPDDSALGFEWPIDLETGALRPDVYERWHASSPMALLETPEGIELTRGVSLAPTSGRNDGLGLLPPTDSVENHAPQLGTENPQL